VVIADYACAEEMEYISIYIKEEKKMLKVGKLSVGKLKWMSPGEQFATGTGTYPEVQPIEIRWVAVRGLGMHDWFIYYHKISKDVDFITREGDKMFTESVIKRLVPCDDGAYGLYRT